MGDRREGAGAGKQPPSGGRSPEESHSGSGHLCPLSQSIWDKGPLGPAWSPAHLAPSSSGSLQLLPPTAHLVGSAADAESPAGLAQLPASSPACLSEQQAEDRARLWVSGAQPQSPQPTFSQRLGSTCPARWWTWGNTATMGLGNGEGPEQPAQEPCPCEPAPWQAWLSKEQTPHTTRLTTRKCDLGYPDV